MYPDMPIMSFTRPATTTVRLRSLAFADLGEDLVARLHAESLAEPLGQEHSVRRRHDRRRFASSSWRSSASAGSPRIAVR